MIRTASAVPVIVVALAALGRGQTLDPSRLPRVERADLVIAGAFRVPVEFDYGGQVMAWNPSGPSLLLSKETHVAEISIPAPTLGAAVTDLPRASFRRGLVDLVGPQRTGIGSLPANKLGGLLVHEGRLYGSAYNYYDADNSQERSHFSYSLEITDAASFRGWSQVWGRKQSGFVAGAMTPIPVEWQGRLGGPALTGQCCIPIISRTSFGPSAFAIDPSQIGQPTVAATPLLYYPGDHPTLGPWSGSNPTYGATTMIGGMVIVPGTRSLLYFGSNGTGPYCYGEGTWEKAKAGGSLCYDPANPHQSPHAYPYNSQVWAYDLNDLAAVKAGTKRPWDVVPYGVWPLALPGTPSAFVLSAVTIDPASRTIYVAQYKGEPTDDGGGRPVIWTLTVKGSTPIPRQEG